MKELRVFPWRSQMVQHGLGLRPRIAAKPSKRVTFYTAPASVKEHKQRGRGKNMNRIRIAEKSADHVQPASHHDNTYSTLGRSKHTRPHSKTTILGASLKTRLHCNHLMQKCKCFSTNNRNKAHKPKHMVQGGIQRKVLSSSRALPRGEMNGRKIYQSTDESVSICDATWKPNLNNSKERSKTNNENHSCKYRNRDERLFKKKLRFQDQVAELNETYNPGRIINSVKDINTNKSQNQNEILTSSSIQDPSTYYRDNSNKDSKSKTKETYEDYCRLCEASNDEFFSGSNRIKKKDQMHNNHSETTTKFYPEYKDPSSHNDLCFLCHRYRNHKCLYDGDNYGKICNTHLCCLQEGMTESENALPQKDSLPAQDIGGENNHTSYAKIPYEPRTKFVKNLKEKLETTYMKDESKERRSMETTAALRETEGYKDPHRQHSQAHHIHHGKKCLHHYQQNDRLFLEPTITNRKGQSVCTECGASQPRDPQREPYLYHITLGGLKTNTDKRHGSASNRGKENSRLCNMKSKKVSNDKSKFLYAKLNDSIDNIFGKKGMPSAFSRPAAPLNYPVPTYSKRPPSRSMALMDHII